MLRGLLIRSEHLDNILSGKKTYEIRNMFCRCVAVDEEFYLLRVPPKGSPKNKNGQGFFTIAGTAIFRANHWINHAAFDSFYDLHFVQPDEYAKMRSARGLAS